MTFRLHHRHSYDPLSITHCLSLKAPRLTTPQQWHWAWPLHSASPSASSSSLTLSTHSPATSPVRHVWVSAIRSLNVSDDAQFIAFVSQHGAVALAHPASDQPPMPVKAPPHHFQDSASLEWCQVATCVTFFEISPSSSSPARHILAVGYASGAIALYDSATIRLLSVSKLPTNAPIRHLRFYPALHHIPQTNGTNQVYPSVTRNSGLFAVVGWSGMIAHLPADEMHTLILQPSVLPDAYAAGWIIWHLSNQDVVLDAAVCGSGEAAVYNASDEPNAASTALRIVTVGLNAPIGIHYASPNPPFSARAAAARVATSFMSAARGFLFSRLSTEPITSNSNNGSDSDPLLPTPSLSQQQAITGSSSTVASWVDEPDSYASMFKMGDSRASSVRKALSASFYAGLKKGRPRTDNVAIDKRSTSSISRATRSGSAPYSSKATSANARSTAAAKFAAATGKSGKQSSSNTATDTDVVRRVHSSMAKEDIAALLARYAKNMRVVERVESAPTPCSLLASCDTLGRIFIQDPRDFCVLRVLKGYRDANIAWLARQDEMPLLVIHATRLDVVELHGPLEQRRREAFRVLPGTVMIQTTNYRPYCVFPDGRIFEVTPSQPSSPSLSSFSVSPISTNNNKKQDETKVGTKLPSLRPSLLAPETDHHMEQAPDYELTGAFVEAVKSGRASHAVECLEKVANDFYKVAHLMATLVACTSQIRVDVHMALAAKAGQLAAEVQNPDLVCRFEAHRRLAEAFQLIEAEPILTEISADRLRGTRRHGPRLIEHELGSGLAELSMEELSSGWNKTQFIPGRRVAKRSQKDRNGDMDEFVDAKEDFETDKHVNDDDEVINCEQFILSHCLVPTVDLEMDSEYEILPRSDLSDRESVWLSMAYFGKLLELDSASVNMAIPTAGREHPSTAEIFAALAHYVGLSEAEITRQYVRFFLHAPLVPLLNTYVALHASALQCTLSRIRTRFTREVVDPILLDACETTTHVANAVLLVRLCAMHGADEDDYAEDSWGRDVGDDARNANPYIESLDRLNEALAFQRLVIGSSVTRDTREMYIARRFSGQRGDAEKMAVMELLNANEYSRVVAVFEGRASGIRRVADLKPNEAADVSSVALEACRIKMAAFLSERNQTENTKQNDQNDQNTENDAAVDHAIIPKNVMSWIRSAEREHEKKRSTTRVELSADAKVKRLSDIRAVLMAAHAHIPDSSVDAVRSLQLAEAISALIEVERKQNTLNS